MHSTAESRGKTKRPSPTVYTLRVALRYDSDVWRKIEIRSDQTLDELHWAIFKAFNRDEDHLYSFYLTPPGARRSARSLPHKNAIEFTDPQCYDGYDWGNPHEVHDASQTRLADLKLRASRKFDYLFDFGDSWKHEITVEQVNGEIQRHKYPRVIEKHGTSPPQYESEW